MNTTFQSTHETMLAPGTGKKKKILIANIPADGHFNPLTSVAMALKEAGHDVRWYTGPTYAPKIEKLGIPYYLFNKAKEVTVHNIDDVFPERKTIKNHVKKVIFDICTYFIERGPEFYEDIKDINAIFDFDVLVADNAFTGILFVKEKLKKQTAVIGVLPLAETSKELPPPIMGLTPAGTMAGRAFHGLLRLVMNKVLLKKPHAILREQQLRYGLPKEDKNIFDIQIAKSTVYLQSGTPGLEYKRRKSEHIHFIGPLLPYTRHQQYTIKFEDKLRKYDKVILVTQGTFEGDVNKLIIPTIEAYKNSNNLVVVTTAGWHTAMLRERYKSYDNIVIEDFIPFNSIMPYADVYVSNGGFGGVMLSINNKLPMVVGGVHEGKNEICARVGYFKLGVNMHTERPTPGKIRKAVAKVLADKQYQKNVEQLSKEFAEYEAAKICERYISRLPVTVKA